MVTDKKISRDAAVIKRNGTFHCGGFAVSKAGALKGVFYPRHRFKVERVESWCRDVTGSVVLYPMIAASAGSGVMFTSGNILAIDATAEKYKLATAFTYMVAGAYREKAITTAITFTAAHVVSASKFGVILVQIDASGTVSTKVAAATQAYDSAAAALAAKPSPDSGNIEVGYIAIAAKAATWTANTDDLTNGSDLTTAAFNTALSIARTPCAAGITFADGTRTDETLSSTPANLIGSATDAVFLAYVTDGTGAVAGGDGEVRIGYRILGVNGEA